jgi:hypothetical protein
VVPFEAFMADPPTPSFRGPIKPAGKDRRGSPRFPSLDTSARVVAAVGDDFCLAKIRNISPGGVSLVVSRSFEAGTILTVDLIETKTNRFSRTLEVEVRYATEHPNGDWILGGQFLQPLTAEEVRIFLGDG